ncbi:MAG: endolytic transglycosylase MltG [Proteobacteria bacterium]|nr:endolytic transglycosylase MltG [Pseudomonadota bacterium]
MRRFLAASLAFLILLAVLGAGALLWGNQQFKRPGPSAEDRVVVLPRGAGLGDISRRLASAGVIDRPWLFLMGVRLAGASRGLQAGEFLFTAGLSAEGVMNHLLTGRPVARRLTVPEGMTSRDVIALIDAAVGLEGFIAGQPDEGALLPETYHYGYGDYRAEMVERMTAAMTETLAALWSARQDGLPFETPGEALILASMVERETALADERRHVAGVFINRLRRGMRLQSDPTVIYGLTGGEADLERPLSRADLKHDSPYNTYRIKGLPPGPIANPGRDSIAAVLDPLETRDLYFVADGGGGHVFAASLAEHNRNVAKWRKLQQSRD